MDERKMEGKEKRKEGRKGEGKEKREGGKEKKETEGIYHSVYVSIYMYY